MCGELMVRAAAGMGWAVGCLSCEVAAHAVAGVELDSSHLVDGPGKEPEEGISRGSP